MSNNRQQAAKEGAEDGGSGRAYEPGHGRDYDDAFKYEHDKYVTNEKNQAFEDRQAWQQQINEEIDRRNETTFTTSNDSSSADQTQYSTLDFGSSTSYTSHPDYQPNPLTTIKDAYASFNEGLNSTVTLLGVLVVIALIALIGLAGVGWLLAYTFGGL